MGSAYGDKIGVMGYMLNYCLDTILSIQYKDGDESSVVDPQELMNTGCSSMEDSWDKYVSSPPADDGEPSVRDATSAT